MTTEVGHISGMLQSDQGRGHAADPPAQRADQPDPGHRRCRPADLDRHRPVARTRPIDELFLTAIAFAVSAIPTGLPAVVTAILSRGTTTLAAAGAIVKRLRSVETLGSTSAINSDKTGTLTLNQMTAVQMAVVHGRYAISGEGYSTEGQITHVGGQADGPLDCADAADGAVRRRRDPRRRRWSATRPKARSSSSRRRAASTRPSPASATRASRPSRSTRPTSSWRRSTG